MLIGYNQPRPKKKNYQDFLRKLVRGLKELDEDGLSLMLHGSYVRGDYVPGRSDIDATLILPNDVVTDKKLLREISLITYHALCNNNIPFQVTLLDLTTMRDGRFNSYTHEFMAYFKTEGKIVVGPDYRDDMFCLESKIGDLGALSFNLRKIRIGLLFAEKNRREDYKRYLENLMQTLNAVSRGSKQVLYLIDGEVRKNRFSALKEMPQKFPNINLEPLEEISYLFHNLHKLDQAYKNPEEVQRLTEKSTTFLEEVIREYIYAFPLRKRKKS